MKLFDRSVDLAQFDEDSPLYPICRSWLKNRPYDRELGKRDKSPSPDRDSHSEDEVMILFVYCLPVAKSHIYLAYQTCIMVGIV